MNRVDVRTRTDLSGKVLRRIRKFALQVLKKIDVRFWEISLLICDNPFIRELNRKYRNIDSATDVLSFALEETPFPGEDNTGNEEFRSVGDIVISIEKCREQAGAFGVSLNQEMKKMIIHGILHLYGMDHEKDDDASVMQQREDVLNNEFSGVRIV